MTPFLYFISTFSFAFGLLVIMVAWFFRTSSAHIFWKLFLSTLIAVFVCWTPFTVFSLMGYPTQTVKNKLPQKLQLLAFQPHDEEKTVDIWALSVANGDRALYPRSYEIPLDKQLKEMLSKARDMLAQGRPVFLEQKSEGKDSGKGGADGKKGKGKLGKLGRALTNFFDSTPNDLTIDREFDAPDKK